MFLRSSHHFTGALRLSISMFVQLPPAQGRISHGLQLHRQLPRHEEGNTGCEELWCLRTPTTSPSHRQTSEGSWVLVDVQSYFISCSLLTCMSYKGWHLRLVFVKDIATGEIITMRIRRISLHCRSRTLCRDALGRPQLFWTSPLLPLVSCPLLICPRSVWIRLLMSIFSFNAWEMRMTR